MTRHGGHHDANDHGRQRAGVGNDLQIDINQARHQQGFNQLQMGYASAQAFILAIAILIFSFINMRINKSEEPIV